MTIFRGSMHNLVLSSACFTSVSSCCCSMDEVKSHLQEYFDRSRQTMQAAQAIDENLCLLCIQCLEVKHAIMQALH